MSYHQPMDAMLSTRCTQDEFDRLNELAELAGLPRAVVVREALELGATALESRAFPAGTPEREQAIQRFQAGLTQQAILPPRPVLPAPPRVVIVSTIRIEEAPVPSKTVIPLTWRRPADPLASLRQAVATAEQEFHRASLERNELYAQHPGHPGLPLADFNRDRAEEKLAHAKRSLEAEEGRLRSSAAWANYEADLPDLEPTISEMQETAGRFLELHRRMVELHRQRVDLHEACKRAAGENRRTQAHPRPELPAGWNAPGQAFAEMCVQRPPTTQAKPADYSVHESHLQRRLRRTTEQANGTGTLACERDLLPYFREQVEQRKSLLEADRDRFWADPGHKRDNPLDILPPWEVPLVDTPEQIAAAARDRRPA